MLFNFVRLNKSSDRCFSPGPWALENVCLFANFRGRQKYQPLLIEIKRSVDARKY